MESIQSYTSNTTPAKSIVTTYCAVKAYTYMHVNFQSSLEMIYATLIRCVLSTLFRIFFPFPYDVVNMGVDSLLAGNIWLPIFLFKLSPLCLLIYISPSF